MLYKKFAILYIYVPTGLLTPRDLYQRSTYIRHIRIYLYARPEVMWSKRRVVIQGSLLGHVSTSVQSGQSEERSSDSSGVSTDLIVNSTA